MDVYIKGSKDFKTKGHYETNDFTLYPATATDQKGNVVINKELQDVSGDWLIAGGSIYTISKATPKNGKTTITAADPVDFFSRDILIDEELNNSTAGGFIAAVITSQWIQQEDPEYRFSYINVIDQSNIAYIVPETDEGIFNFAEYIKTVINAGLRVDISVVEKTMTIKLRNASRKTNVVSFEDGHAQLTAATFSSTMYAKATIRKPYTTEEEQQEYEDFTYYLAEDGTVHEAPPAKRAAGKWVTVVCRENDIPIEKAQELFDKNKAGYKVEFYSDREYKLHDNVALMLPSGNFMAIISEIQISSKDTRYFYRCGQMSTTVSETITAVNNVVSGNITGNTTALEAYPVGSIYLTTQNVTPASLFGGTWKQIKGRFLLGCDSNHECGSTGGEETHTLTINEMPIHSHSGLTSAGTVGASGSAKITGAGSTTGSAGGGKAHNNMPPYLSVYIWERIG